MAKTATKEKKTKETKEKALVIVESPAKAKTIKKILGSNFEIKASYGHIRDLPKKSIGYEETPDFEPTFEIIKEKEKVVNELNKSIKGVDKIYLAPDPDREGEAIAWHVAQVLKAPKEKLFRIEFNEITPKAIKFAVDNPREIDMDRVRAQQSRQILDKLVGFKISPILWKKMKNYRLSAGRVQSVALRLICEKEELIDAFVPVEYWTIAADMDKEGTKFVADLTKYQGKKIEINNEAESQKILDTLSAKGVKFTVDKINHRDTTRNPNPPFITSTLQREASNKLGYGVSKTMQVAQKLYEGIDVGEGGPTGLITYMRTDSTRISDDATAEAKEFIINSWGEEFYPKEPRDYAKKGKKNVQDAHEAIRPTYVHLTPEKIKNKLNSEQFRLYSLIWNRFVASQMESAKVKNISVDIEALDYTFKIGTSKVTFEGFLKVYGDEEEKKSVNMPDFKEGENIKLDKLTPTQHFTQPPARYTEASLVKILEEYGIGRPSTYASIITKIQQRNYVEKTDRSLAPTLLGKTVNEQLVKHFASIVNYEFTAMMENQLDDVAESKVNWRTMLDDFYHPFVKTVDDAAENMEDIVIDTGEKCPECGKAMILKSSRFGNQFMGCSGYPECKTALPLPSKDGSEATPPPADEPTDEKCEKCQGEMIIKHGPYGKYFQCLNEECKNKQKIVVKTGVKCNKCDKGELVEKRSRYGKIFYACDQYPNCQNAIWGKPTGEKCPECGSLLGLHNYKRGDMIKCSNKECKYKKSPEEQE